MRFWRRSNKDFAAEVESHLALDTDRLIAEGVEPREAAARARRAFGNVTVTRELFRIRGWRIVLEQLGQDLRYAARSLRRSPGFAAIAILCLAVGISVNTAAFSFLNGLLFSDFPGVVNQRDLAAIRIGYESEWGRSGPAWLSIPEWEEFQRGMPAFSHTGAYGMARVSARTTGDPEGVRADIVSPGFFAMLGTAPAAGRFFTPSEDRGDANTVVLSHAYWQRVFEGRADVTGKTVMVATHPFTVIGVAPEGFVGLYPGEVLDPDITAPAFFLPLAAAPLIRERSATPNVDDQLGDRWLRLVGRIRDGASIEQARAQAANVASRIAARFPDRRNKAYAVVNGGGGMTAKPGEAIMGVVFVMAVPVIILIVACANLANQLLTRGVQRSREIAVRLSLGATRARVVRQLLVEAAAIAAAASIVGMLFARWILDALRAFFLALPFRIPFDGRVVLFTAGVAAFTAIVFGLSPALRATRADLSASLKERSPGGGYRRSRLQGALIVVQIAASLALIAVAGVFVDAAQPRGANSSGSGIANRAVIELNTDLIGLGTDARRTYQATLVERLSSMPGVTAAAIAPFYPFTPPNENTMRDVTHGASDPDYDDVAEVTGDWFGVTGMRPIAGRLLTAQELNGAPVVAVVDAAFARNWWRDSSALGRSIRIDEDSNAIVVTVVGVVDTVWGTPMMVPEGQIIIPGARRENARTIVHVRTSGPAEPMLDAIRNTVREVDTRMPILWVRTFEDVTAREIAPMAMLGNGLRGLGLVALSLAALGLFGVMSFVVAQRRREIGIRVALGARSQDVTWMVLRQAMKLGVLGALIGTAIATAVVTVFRSGMHGLPALEPVSVVIAAAAMCGVAAFASLVPARRAASVDPNVALRDEG